nr:hypothetical protein [uncultured Brumimicrobium sp.]
MHINFGKSLSGSPNDLDGTIRIPTLKGTHHYLFNDDGTFYFDPTTLPESRDKKAENNKINSNSEYPGVGLPPP